MPGSLQLKLQKSREGRQPAAPAAFEAGTVKKCGMVPVPEHALASLQIFLPGVPCEAVQLAFRLLSAPLPGFSKGSNLGPTSRFLQHSATLGV